MASPSRENTRQISEWPEWLRNRAVGLADQWQNLVLPEGQLRGYNPELDQSVAGMTPEQQAALQRLSSGSPDQTGSYDTAQQQLTGVLEGQNAANNPYVSGGNQGFASDPNNPFQGAQNNPYLDQMYNRAARNMTEQYQTATAPQLQADAMRAGAYGGSAYDEAKMRQQFGLQSGLNDLATNVYGQAYETERGRQQQGYEAQRQREYGAQEEGRARQLQAIMGSQDQQLQAQALLPQFLQSQLASYYMPAQAQLEAGNLLQQQQQSELDVGMQNAVRREQYPFQLLEQYGSGLQTALGPESNQLGISRSRPGGVGATLGLK